MAEANGFDKPNGSNGSGAHKSGHRPGYTGRFLISFEPGTGDQAAGILKNKAGVSARSARDAGAEAGSASENMVFEEIGAAVVSAAPEQQRALLAAAADSAVPVSLVEPERVVWAAMLGTALARGATRANSVSPEAATEPGGSPMAAPPGLPAPAGLNADFLRGYAAAIQGLLASMEGGVSPSFSAARELEATAASATWGLQATRVTLAAHSGQGIRVAVLDTGFDLHHPDFGGRTIVSRSFVDGELVQDGNGHGTHCVGVSCGPKNPLGTQRYGVAYGAEIYVGKVLSDAGSGADGGILAGINWAVQNKCHIVSMSLGAPVTAGETFSQTYQNAARIAEQKGTLIIAAAGNESQRPGELAPVCHPANCPTILAVGALDSALQVAWFSCGSVNGEGGDVNIAAPGVDVFSSWPMPMRYNTISGTSMATPCVAGIFALYAEATGLRGMALANFVLKKSRRLAPVRDFGWGLVQAV